MHACGVFSEDAMTWKRESTQWCVVACRKLQFPFPACTMAYRFIQNTPFSWNVYRRKGKCQTEPTSNFQISLQFREEKKALATKETLISENVRGPHILECPVGKCCGLLLLHTEWFCCNPARVPQRCSDRTHFRKWRDPSPTAEPSSKSLTFIICSLTSHLQPDTFETMNRSAKRLDAWEDFKGKNEIRFKVQLFQERHSPVCCLRFRSSYLWQPPPPQFQIAFAPTSSFCIRLCYFSTEQSSWVQTKRNRSSKCRFPAVHCHQSDWASWMNYSSAFMKYLPWIRVWVLLKQNFQKAWTWWLCTFHLDEGSQELSLCG